MAASSIPRTDTLAPVRRRLERVHARLRRALATLEPRERRVLEARLLGSHTSLSELGRELGLSMSSVRELELRAAGKLRGALRWDTL